MVKNIPLTFIYSNPSIKPFEELVNHILDLCGEHVLRVEDIFDYGVFCTTGTYTCYEWLEDSYDFEIPAILTSICTSISEKEYYVNSVIEQVMRKEIEKPEWMIYVEEEASCNNFTDTPSNFLRISTKYVKYMDLPDYLIKFLYSPNLMTTLMK